MNTNTIFQDYLSLLHHSKCNLCLGYGFAIPHRTTTLICPVCWGNGFNAPITFIAEQLDDIQIKYKFIL